MDAIKARAWLGSLISSFDSRIAEPQELVIARNMYPESSVADLSEVDAGSKAMEFQPQEFEDCVRETLAFTKKNFFALHSSFLRPEEMQLILKSDIRQSAVPTLSDVIVNICKKKNFPTDKE